MKCQCQNPAQIKGFGIIDVGETIELPDHMAKDPIIVHNFKIIPGTLKNPNAKPTAENDVMKKARKKLLDELGLEAMRDALVDAHINVKKSWSAEKIVDLYIDEFGVFEPQKREPPPEGGVDGGAGASADGGVDGEGGKGGSVGEGGAFVDPTDPGSAEK